MRYPFNCSGEGESELDVGRIHTVVFPKKCSAFSDSTARSDASSRTADSWTRIRAASGIRNGAWLPNITRPGGTLCTSSGTPSVPSTRAASKYTPGVLPNLLQQWRPQVAIEDLHTRSGHDCHQLHQRYKVNVRNLHQPMLCARLPSRLRSE